MEKLSKILLGINIVLIVALIVMTCLYFNARKTAKENRDAYVNLSAQLYELTSK